MIERETQNRIMVAVRRNMDDLEDHLNTRLRDILDELKVEDEEALVFARQVFFQG